jgi:hypothetical protein
MSYYSDFISVFPSRCLDVLKAFSEQATLDDREVTLLLCVASAGIVVPYERLKSSEGGHPMRDRNRYSEAAKRFDALLTEPFLLSPLGRGTHDWRWKGAVDDVNSDPIQWSRVARPLARDKKGKNVVPVIRHALAHGNIKVAGDPINELHFLAENRRRDDGSFRLLVTSPASFASFVRNWLEAMKRPRLPEGIVAAPDDWLLEAA